MKVDRKRVIGYLYDISSNTRDIMQLKDITKKIVKYYSPEKIILYGSYGKSCFKKHSDLDLLIIKDTEKRPAERQMEVEKIFTNRTLPLDIEVYTSQEVRYLFSIGSPFIEEIMEKGRLLYMRKITAAWIKDAIEEFDSAIILYDHEKYRGACYHSQQCVEKGLKAIIPEKGEKPEKIHDIVELLKNVELLGFNTGLSVDNAIFLNSIYKGRYPTERGLLPHGEPLKQDAETAIESAKIFIEKLKTFKTGTD